MRATPALALLVTLAACSAQEPDYDPSLVGEDPTLAVVEVPDAEPARTGLLGWLSGGTRSAEAQAADAAAEDAAPARAPGFFARLFGGGAGPNEARTDAATDVAAAPEDALAVDPEAVSDGDAAGATQEAEPARRGFFAALFGPRGDAADDRAAQATQSGAGDADGTDTAGADSPGAGTPDAATAAADGAAPSDDPAVIEAATGGRPRGGFLAGLFGAPAAAAPAGAAAVDATDIVAGEALDYGRIRRVCDVSGAALGQRIAVNDATGYALHDTDPGATGLRSFHLTGFADGCAREFSAALAMFGSLSVYERIRLGAPAATQPLAATDAEYDRIKRAVCRVGPDDPCGDRLSDLEARTAFVSIYERLGSNPRWKNLLLHDGAVAALDIKTR